MCCAHCSRPRGVRYRRDRDEDDNQVGALDKSTAPQLRVFSHGFLSMASSDADSACTPEGDRHLRDP